MSNIDNKIKKVFNFCDEKHYNPYFDKIVGMIKDKVSDMDANERKVFFNDFQVKFDELLNESLNEDIGSSLRNLTLGALLATCIVNPALAKIKIENIETDHPVIAKYESGKKGYDCIVKDNYGGYSYGKYQISTERRDGKDSTFDYFMKYAKENNPHIEYQLRKAGGWDAAHKGNKEFINKWCQLSYRKDFQDLYNNFLRDREFIPVYNRMDAQSQAIYNEITDWASSNRAVQAAIHSAIVQHGKNGAFKLIKKIATNKKVKNPLDFVEKLYNLRAQVYKKYKSRYKDELKDIKNYYSSDEAII